MNVPNWVAPALFGGLFVYSVMKAKGLTKSAKSQENKRVREAAKMAAKAKNDERQEEEEEEEEEEESDEDEDLKMVLVVRKDLKMGTGKMCAQCCHAAVGVIERVMEGTNTKWKEWYFSWSRRGCTKIAVKANTEQDIIDVQAACRAANIPYYLVRDAGRTQIASGSKTVISVGPAPISEVDAICASYKLL
eukprot:TRINITY_DN26371_c0_g1_i1.p1 TRINITY_DN26371_c0_g1~~TRINITY_DN26371_c0_g1_i1.p1  ORF type:complete len:191 (+),score=39.92 TRINITY_DN26371_c0_g1_i1:15-587(+)